MVEIICHRRNSIAELASTDSKYGVEVDVRIYLNRLVVQHDPFTEGPLLEDWLLEYRHGTLILNLKEEGIEASVLELLNERNIRNFFFLDQSFPYIIKYANTGFKKSAVRVSEFESLQTALNISQKIDWAWIDCFTEFPLTGNEMQMLERAGLKTCIVSPELQGRTDSNEILKLSADFLAGSVMPDAICTKNPALWMESDFFNETSAS